MCCAVAGALACGGPDTSKLSRAPAKPTTTGPAASYKGGTITHEEVAKELARLPPALRESFGSAAGQKELARSLVDKRLLVEEARRRGLAAEPTIHKQVEEMEERLIVQALLADEEKKAGQSSEAELRSFFEAHKADFERPARAKVARVLAALPAGAPAAEQAKARAKAEKWAARLRKGEELAKLASEGEGAERTRGGDLGFLVQGQGDDLELVKAAFALTEVRKPGVVQCKDGIAVIEILEKQEKRLPSFEEVRGEVEGRVAPVKKRKIFDAVLERLRGGADVRIDARPP
jgi:peptidyl-prolyl cis-trans isomerase C